MDDTTEEGVEARNWLHHSLEQANVRGEQVFNVMAAIWFCGKSGWNGKVEDVKPVL